MKKFLSIVLCAILFFGVFSPVLHADGKSFEITGEKEVEVGKTIQLSIVPDDGMVSWESSDSTIASVSDDGKVTGIKKGTVNIIAKSGEKVASLQIEVFGPVAPNDVYVYENYGSNNVHYYGVYERNQVISFETFERAGYTLLGFSLNDPNGSVIAKTVYKVTGEEDGLRFYAQWKKAGLSSETSSGKGHPALEEAIKIADKFKKVYGQKIASSYYSLRTSFERAYNRVVSLNQHVFYGREYYYENYDYLVENYKSIFGYYPTAKEFYDYYGFDYYEYDLVHAYYQKYGTYPTAEQFYKEYGFYEEDYRPYAPYHKKWNQEFWTYSENVMEAVNRLVDTIRDLAIHNGGDMLREYGNLPYIAPYGYEWSGYYGYVRSSGEKKLKELIDKAEDILKDKPQTVYPELHEMMNLVLDDVYKALNGRGDVKNAISELERAIKRVDQYKPTDKKYMEPYMVGDSNGKFHPDKSLTRGELAVMLNRIIGLGQTFSGSGWAERAALNLKGLGYLKGDPNGNLLLSKPVSMKEMATLLVRMKGYETIGGNVYPGKTTWATPYIQRAWAEGWLTDMKEVNPESFLTRGQVARMINRAFKREIMPGTTSPNFSDVPKMHKYFHDIKIATSKGYIN